MQRLCPVIKSFHGGKTTLLGFWEGGQKGGLLMVQVEVWIHGTHSHFSMLLLLWLVYFFVALAILSGR